MADRVVVLGIDPGTITTGYGAVSLERGALSALGWGSVTTSSSAPLAERLARIHAEVARRIEEYRPDEIACVVVKSQSKKHPAGVRVPNRRTFPRKVGKKEELSRAGSRRHRHLIQSIIGIRSAECRFFQPLIGFAGSRYYTRDVPIPRRDVTITEKPAVIDSPIGTDV